MTMYGGTMYQTAAPGVFATNPGMMASPMMQTQQPMMTQGLQAIQTAAANGETATDTYADVFPAPQGAHATRKYEPLATDETPHTRERQDGCCKVYRESRPRMCLLVVSLLALAFPVLLLLAAVNARDDNSFAVYNDLSLADGGSDFSTLLLLLAVLAVLAMIALLVGVFASGQADVWVVRPFVIASLVLSVLLMILGVYVYAAESGSTPGVVRTANEICQGEAGTSASWSCPAAAAGTASSAVGIGAAHGGAASWLASRSPDLSTTGCSELSFLCTPPGNYPAQAACVCSGQSAQAWLPLPAPAVSGRFVGAYCNDWGNATAAYGGWCFVSQSLSCGEITLDLATGYLRSNGPCGDEVDSRSQAVYDGASSVQAVCMWTAIVGLCLLLASWAGLWLHTAPRSAPVTRGLHAETHETQDVAKRFDNAQLAAVSSITASTPERVKLEIYGYFKQAREGDVTGSRPGLLSGLERKKYDAWARHRGMPKEEAMMHYCSAVDLV